MTAFVGSITAAILLIDVATLDEFRFWVVGSLAEPRRHIAASRAVHRRRRCCSRVLGTDVERDGAR